jgi:copper chaperone CopZ
MLMTAFVAAALLATAAPRLANACGGDDDKAPPAPTAKKATPKHAAVAAFKVDGMHCDGCAAKVKNGLLAKDGVVEVNVSMGDHRVTVKYDADKLDTAKIAKMISEIGYKATAEA